MAAFLKLLQHGHPPLVKSDGTGAIGPKAAVGNMFYSWSGGSTGEPKLICRSCKSWALSFQENAILFTRKHKKPNANFGHLSHSLTLYAVLVALTTGAEYHPLEGLGTKQQWKMIAHREIQILYAKPTQLRILTKSATLHSRLRAVRGVMIGGGWLDRETKQRVQELCLNAETKEFYGAAETSFITISDPSTPPGLVGQPYTSVPTKVLDTAENKVKAGTSGEIWIKSPSLFSRYTGGVKQHTRWRNGWLSIG